MKLQYIIISLCLLTSAHKLLGQPSQTAQPAIPFLDVASQSNMVVIVADLDRPQPCPLKYTNLISNTNLFTLEEQNLIKEIQIKYKNVTTNYIPSGSVLIGLEETNGGWIAHFQYTNSDAHEEIKVDAMGLLAKFRAKSDEGYDVTIYNYKPDMNGISDFEFDQIRHGVNDGLALILHGNHCQSWMRFADGKAVGKWFEWGQELDEAGKLIIEVEFKQPYDYKKHMLPINMGSSKGFR
jgi:hypothetical protein